MSMPIAYWTTMHEKVGQTPIQWLFNRFDGMYPKLFRENFPSPDSIENWKETWAEAFSEDRLSWDEIRIGLRDCRRTKKYPPTIMEFLNCCRPPIDYDKAFYEAVDQMTRRKRPVSRVRDGEVVQVFLQDAWSNPAIFWAAKAMCNDLFLHYREARPRFGYELDKVLAGEVKPVPKNVPKLESSAGHSKDLTPEENENIMNMIKKVHELINSDAKI